MASDLTREQLRAAAEWCDGNPCVKEGYTCPAYDHCVTCETIFRRAYLTADDARIAAERRVAELEAQAKGGELGPWLIPAAILQASTGCGVRYENGMPVEESQEVRTMNVARALLAADRGQK